MWPWKILVTHYWLPRDLNLTWHSLYCSVGNPRQYSRRCSRLVGWFEAAPQNLAEISNPEQCQCWEGFRKFTKIHMYKWQGFIEGMDSSRDIYTYWTAPFFINLHIALTLVIGLEGRVDQGKNWCSISLYYINFPCGKQIILEILTQPSQVKMYAKFWVQSILTQVIAPPPPWNFDH